MCVPLGIITTFSCTYCTAEKSSLSELESLSQHIPKEILLSQENIQLSNVIGEGISHHTLYKQNICSAYYLTIHIKYWWLMEVMDTFMCPRLVKC